MRKALEELVGGRERGQEIRKSLARGALLALALSFTLLAAAQVRIDSGEPTGGGHLGEAVWAGGATGAGNLQIVATASTPEYSSWRLAQRLDPGRTAGQTVIVAAGGQAGGAAAEDLRLVSLAIDAAAQSRGLAHTRIGQWLDRGDGYARFEGGGSAGMAPGISPSLTDDTTRVVREAICPGPWRTELVASADVVAPQAVRTLHVCQVILRNSP